MSEHNESKGSGRALLDEFLQAAESAGVTHLKIGVDMPPPQFEPARLLCDLVRIDRALSNASDQQEHARLRKDHSAAWQAAINFAERMEPQRVTEEEMAEAGRKAQAKQVAEPPKEPETGAWTCNVCGFRGFWSGVPHCDEEKE
jgi:rubrerythrin